MPGFKDALKAYKANTSATPAVNPPEAPAIMEKQTEPETEGKPEPAPLEVSKPAAKTRAPRGSSKKSAEPAASTASAPTTDAPASEGEAAPAAGSQYDSSELDYLLALVKRRLPAGVSVTIVGG